jgi:hypothetical protein
MYTDYEPKKKQARKRREMDNTCSEEATCGEQRALATEAAERKKECRDRKRKAPHERDSQITQSALAAA